MALDYTRFTLYDTEILLQCVHDEKNYNADIFIWFPTGQVPWRIPWPIILETLRQPLWITQPTFMVIAFSPQYYPSVLYCISQLDHCLQVHHNENEICRNGTMCCMRHCHGWERLQKLSGNRQSFTSPLKSTDLMPHLKSQAVTKTAPCPMNQVEATFSPPAFRFTSCCQVWH